ncbi:hypothetical protein JTB14_014717 [Gonioctena quinquepunctata]|nr:hypothetical protein JTB14_014717 [Gonioctena quinquepunctata]
MLFYLIESQYIFNYVYSLDNKSLSQVDEMKNLVDIYDEKLSFALHIEMVVAKSNRMSGFVLRTSRNLSSQLALKSSYYTYVYSKVTYASVIWCPQYEVYKHKLEMTQNKLLRFLDYEATSSKNNMASIYYFRQKYQLHTREKRGELSDVLFLYELLNDSPTILSNIGIHVPSRPLRNNPLFEISSDRTNSRKIHLSIE